MKKKTLADQIAKKAFESDQFQSSWQIHTQAFGPILEPAFADNYQARVHLTAALNHLSKRDAQASFNKLATLKDSCECNADHAALMFFFGLCFEVMGEKDRMLACYTASGEYGHRFYLPYLKIAKSAYSDSVYDIAEQNYRSAISCYDGVALSERDKVILASAYSNLAACLTMMHRYSDAENALVASAAILPQQQGREATQAILYAAMGNEVEATKCIENLKLQHPTLVSPTQQNISKILNGTHPHFHIVEINHDNINRFWQWFKDHAPEMANLAERGSYDEILSSLQVQLASVFPFMERPCELGIMPQEYGYEITFADFYMVSLQNGYEQLIAACPEALRQQWHFTLAH